MELAPVVADLSCQLGRQASSSPVGILLSRSVVVERPAHCGWYGSLSWVLGPCFLPPDCGYCVTSRLRLLLP